MSNASDARYGRITGRRWQAFVAHVLTVKGTVCHLCRTDGADSADHITPISKGGHQFALDNAAPAHLACNKARGNLDLADWFARHPIPTRTALAPSREWFTS
jgi:5-methylcytosine-specific restriction endonuclease McrA